MQDKQRLAEEIVLDALFGLGRLQALVDDPDIENIDVNGCDRVLATGSPTVPPGGAAPVAASDAELVDLIR